MNSTETLYYYSVGDSEYRYTNDSMTDVDFDDAWDVELLAEQCAEDYHSNHDGWEDKKWNSGLSNVRIWLWKDNNTKIGFDVHLEYVPSFSAKRVKE